MAILLPNSWPQKPPLGVPPNRLHPLTRGLVGYWLMNEGGGNRVNDLSGNNRHGILTNGPRWSMGLAGSVVEFDAGASPYTHIAIPSGLMSGYSQASFVTRAKVLTGSSNYGAVFKDANGEFVCQMRSGANIEIIVDATGASGYCVSAGALNPINQWHTVAGVFDGSSLLLYVNGILRATDATCSGTIKTLGALTFGAGTVDTERLEGQIEYVAFYRCALTAAEIARLYREPFAMFRRSRLELWAGAMAPAGGGAAYVENVSVSADGVVSATDVLAMSDAVSVTATGEVSAADKVALSDAVTVEGTGVVTSVEVMAMSDAVTAEAAGIVSATDSFAMIDLVSCEATGVVSVYDFMGAATGAAGAMFLLIRKHR